MKVIFIGSQNIGYGCLEELIKQKHEILLVCTSNPDPHENEWYSSVKILAQKNKIPFEIDPYLNSAYWIKKIFKLHPDCIFVMGWRKLISEKIVSLPSFGSMGIHFSLLPLGRGFAPVNWAIILGWKKTGSSLFYLDTGMDVGAIVSQSHVDISFDDTAKTLNDKLTSASILMFRKMLPKIADKSAPRKIQNHADAQYFSKRIPSDGQIDWKQSSLQIYNLIRGLTYPFPGAFSYLDNRKVFVWKASILEKTPVWYGIPGQILQLLSNGDVLIKTGDGILKIEKVGLTEKEIISPQTYFNKLSIRLK